MTKAETRGILKMIGITSILDVEYFSGKKIVRDIMEDATILSINDLVQEIESRIKSKIDKKYPDNDIYFYFNYLDSQFDGSHEKALNMADKLWK